VPSVFARLHCSRPSQFGSPEEAILKVNVDEYD
jgi:hypothetical protein